MGSFDCYCALCAGPLSIFATTLGAKTKMALKLRNERLELKKRKLGGEKGINENEPYEALEDAEMEDVGNSDEEGTTEQTDPRSSDDEDDDDYSDNGYSESGSDFSHDSMDYSLNSNDSDMNLATISDVAIPPPPPPLAEPVPSAADWSDDDEPAHINEYIGRDSIGSKVDAWYEQNSYDPTKITPDQLRWLGRCRALGFNPNSRGTTKAFYSGRGYYNDYGSFDIDVQGKDPNDPGENLTCFFAHDSNEVPAFPFHEECYKILSRSLGHVDPLKVNKDMMYSVMKQHVEVYGRCLNLDFGMQQEESQFWECWPGEEVCVIDPSYNPEYVELLQEMLPATLHDGRLLPELDSKVWNDPITSLPYDVLHQIVDDLPDKDMLSLMKASWHVNKVTRDNAFWRRMLKIRVHPWLWELESFLKELKLPEKFDYKCFFTWLITVTKFEFGYFGPLSGIANRRRIWRACQELVDSYRDQLKLQGMDKPLKDTTKEEAEEILKNAVSLHTPMVMYPEPKESRFVTTQFLRSWEELTQMSSDLKTYWNEDGNLVGIVLELGSSQRKFGSTEGNEGQSLHIGAGDWIRSITVKICAIDLLNPLMDRSAFSNPMYVRPAATALFKECRLGQSNIMQIELKSGKTKTLRVSNCKATNTREFRVLDNLHLVGLTGQVAFNGIISRLGLLQTPHPSSYIESTDHFGYFDVEKRLWTGLAGAMRYNAITCLPIWRHPVYKHHSLIDRSNYGYRQTDIPADMLPYEVLLWAEVPEMYEYVTSINCLQVIEGTATDCTNTWDTAAMLGFVPGKGSHGIPNHIGTMGPVPSQHSNWDNMKDYKELHLNSLTRWKPRDPKFLKEFTIDGKGGEVITEVHLSNDVRNMKLVTNRGRSCLWGEERPNFPSQDQWSVKRAQPGEVIVGLTGCFGKLGGWNRKARMHSHWKLSDLGVITCASDAKI